ncbi:MAG: hypothetical protein CL878_10305 [Dehalococcoidia bacterium]|nr:hypothetical protein [Dehalococcoidia bacterium]
MAAVTTAVLPTSWPSWRLYIVVFVASACSLVLEIAAGRLLAPEIGVSLYTWTSIIGVVLAGLSVGNYLGGRLADRFPAPSTLGLALLAGSLTSFGVLALLPILIDTLRYLPLVPRVLATNVGLFFLPSCLLGMVTPLAIKQALTDLRTAGGIVGRLYAISTAGSILGVYLTGFVLVAMLGARTVVLLVGIVLLMLALLFGRLRQSIALTVILLVPTLVVVGHTLRSRLWQSPCLTETHYYCIQVNEQNVGLLGPVMELQLDHLIHSYTAIGDPDLLRYAYTQIFAETARYVAQSHPDLRALFIGGGGYTVPLHLEAKYPEAAIDVIEIDPGVTAVSHEWMGLSPDTRIVTYNEDARIAVQRLQEGRYDLIFGDAFNDASVPYHLTTREFGQQLRSLLTDDGIYLANVIDRVYSGHFLRSYLRTMQSLFPHVYLLAREDAVETMADWPHGTYVATHPGDRDTFVVAASQQPIDFTQFRSHRTGSPAIATHVTGAGDQLRWEAGGPRALLTDDYAPVETLLASLFTGDEEQWDWRSMIPPRLRPLLFGT